MHHHFTHIPNEEMIPVMMSVSQIGSSWIQTGHRIKGRIAALIGHERNSKVLPYATRIKLYQEIMFDLEALAKQRTEFDGSLGKILKSIERDRQRKLNERKKVAEPYALHATKGVMQTKRSPSEIEYVLAFLDYFMKLRRETVIRIIVAPNIPSLLSRD